MTEAGAELDLEGFESGSVITLPVGRSPDSRTVFVENSVVQVAPGGLAELLFVRAEGVIYGADVRVDIDKEHETASLTNVGFKIRQEFSEVGRVRMTPEVARDMAVALLSHLIVHGPLERDAVLERLDASVAKATSAGADA